MFPFQLRNSSQHWVHFKLCIKPTGHLLSHTVCCVPSHRHQPHLPRGKICTAHWLFRCSCDPWFFLRIRWKFILLTPHPGCGLFHIMSDSAHNLESEDRPVAHLALAEHQAPWSFLEICFHYIIVWRNLSILTDEFDKTRDSPLPDSPEAFSLGIRSGCSSSLEWYHFISLVSLRSLCWSNRDVHKCEYCVLGSK